ncbi:MAG TPA: ATP-dependent DNA helicase RecQ [Chitinophagaceae bacterium]|nr:ATP-dependent DNA helicase RecQ [Chitinophagaceae bacterium]
MKKNVQSDNSRLTTHEILKEYWGYDAFRTLQEEVINSVLEGKDTLALMPTGGGKSLCYQVPALAKDGLCLVISPLIALMKDQVENLRKKNITAFSIYSGMSRAEVINTLKVASNSNCKFLYISPERLETNLFKEYLPGMNINLVAVDEAHCISQWGYDFRPPYLRIASLREELTHVAFLALTASATKEVQDDICEKLQFKEKNIFRQSFERKNLSYSVFKAESKINKIIDILSKVQGSAILYCKSRKRTKEIAELLQLQNIVADFYHAGLPREERNKRQEDWIKNKIRVIVCTNAFGMGIDKPDVRSVVHADVPDCLENYYQEAGRAGRDGQKSFAVLLYDDNDITELESLAATRYPSLDDMKKVYQSVANYLQIPAGSGEGNYFDFDINDFIKKFKLNTHTTVYALKALEQDNWLALNEQVFLPSKVKFTTNKETLYDFEKTHPALEPAIKALLRGYEGIFDFPTSISELVLIRLLKKNVEEIKKDLLQLHQYGVIQYEPQKDSPQVYFPRNRVRVEDLSINMDLYHKRKEKFVARVKNILQYVTELVTCRSKMIGSYFGDNKLHNCNVCDNCLRQKKVHIDEKEFEKISNRIQTVLAPQPLPSKELMDQLGAIKKEKAWKVIEFLQAENKLEVDNAGWVRLK